MDLKIIWLLLFLLFVPPLYADDAKPLDLRFGLFLHGGTFDKEMAVSGGGQIGLRYGHCFWGGSFSHTMTDHSWTYEASSGNYAGKTFGDLPRKLWYGGGVFEYLFFDQSKFSPFAGILIGGGRSIVSTVGDEIFVIEPRAGFYYNGAGLVSASLAVSYRAGLFSDWFPYSWVSGFGCFLSLHYAQRIKR
jgi:hypothetical protein